MKQVHRAIGRARFRLLVQAWLAATGTLLLVALGVVLALLLVDRVLAVSIPWPAYAAVGGLALLAAPILALMQRPDDARTAALLDDRLKLKDRFGTSLYVSHQAEGDPFAKQVVDDATKTATGLRVAEATPIGFTRSWAWTPVLAAVAAAVFFFVPHDLDPFGLREQQAQAKAEQEQAQRVAEQILQAKSTMTQVNTSSEDLADADPTELQNRLASLTRKDLSSPERRREAAAELTTIQDKLQQAHDLKEQEFRSLQNQMSRLDAGESGPADRFADALRRGDFEAAERELEALAQQFEQMSEAERQQTARQLQNLASQMQAMSQQQALNQQQAQQAGQQAQQQSMQQQLQQQGLSQQQIQQLQQQRFNQQAVQQALQQQGMSQQQAQQTAQQMAQQAQQAGQQAQQQAQQQQQGGQGQQQQQGGGMSQQQQAMSQSLQQMAQGMQSGNGQQVQQGQWSSQQSMQQMQQMQQQLQQMQLTQQQLQQAMNGMGQQPGQQGQGQGQGQGQNQQTQAGGQGGQQWGTGSGGNPLGAQRQAGGQTGYASTDFQDKQGRIIASWNEKGQNAAGDATVEFNTAVTEARDQAERAVTDDRVPRRYHESIQEYFRQLPESPDEARRAPRAPR